MTAAGLPPTAAESRLPLLVATLSGAVALALAGIPGLAGASLVLLGALFGPRLNRLHDWTPAHLAVLVGCGLAIQPLGVVGAFSLLLGWLACHRLVVFGGRDDARVLLLLATLMALIGAVGTLSLALAPALLAYAVATPVAFLRTFGVSRRSLEVGLAASTLALTIAFFLFVPRLQQSFLSGFGEPAASDRFADNVELGDEWSDPDAEALVLRATVRDRAGTLQPGPFYFRGRALDRFDGRAWTASGATQRPAVGSWELKAEIILEPMEGATVYGPPDLLYAKAARGPLLLRNDGSLDHGQPGQRVSYEAFSRVRSLEALDRGSPSLLQLPALDPGIAALAASIAPDERDPRRLAVALARSFSEGFAYDANPPVPEGDPLTWFLLHSRRGHCEYFASGLAVLLRARGVPARLATGFYSAEFNETGGYIAVRRGHAHAWVEVPVRGGWVVLDATPVGNLPSVEVPAWQSAAETLNSAWLSLVLDYDLQRQFDGLARVGALVVPSVAHDEIRTQTRTGLAGAVIVFVGLGLSGTLARLVIWALARPPSRREATDTMVATFARARRQLRKRGFAIPDALPPVEAAAWLRGELGAESAANAAPLEALAWHLYRVRYAGEAPDKAREAQWLSELARIPKRADS